MFLGEYNHSIDAKGRLIVPAKFREELGENFIVTKGLDGCLYIYPDEEWKKFESKLSELPMGKGVTERLYVSFISSNAGRIRQAGKNTYTRKSPRICRT